VCAERTGLAAGTFNHRHAALIDVKTGRDYLPSPYRRHPGAVVAVDSPLSEAGAMGFEYGYSREFPDGLVLWEHSSATFANGAQIIIDQFVSAGETSGTALGAGAPPAARHEGQGPEHSSARVERFLQLAANDNIQVCQPSTSGNYFHLLRRQACARAQALVVFTPKSVLRAEPACSDIAEFHTVLSSRSWATRGDRRARVILCSGKIAHELRSERAREKPWIGRRYHRAVLPVPGGGAGRRAAALPETAKLVWVQEEPPTWARFLCRPRLKDVVAAAT